MKERNREKNEEHEIKWIEKGDEMSKRVQLKKKTEMFFG